jgi:hypothetical protein
MAIYLSPYDWLLFLGVAVVSLTFLLLAVPARGR